MEEVETGDGGLGTELKTKNNYIMRRSNLFKAILAALV